MSATIAPVPTDALFGVFVDLGGRKLWPAPHHMAAGGQLHAPVISVAASDWDDPPLTPPAHRRRSHRRAPRRRSSSAAALARRLSMVTGDYCDPAAVTALTRRRSEPGVKRAVQHLAIPSELADAVVAGYVTARPTDTRRPSRGDPRGREH